MKTRALDGRPADLTLNGGWVRALWCVSMALLLVFPNSGTAGPPTESWLRYYGLEPWEAVLDHDWDGFTADEEFAYGTHPGDPLSHPPQFVPGPDGFRFQIPVMAGVSFGSVELRTSTNLSTWVPVPDFPPPAPGTFTISVPVEETARFFRFAVPDLANSDGDCLLDFEELNLFHTDPLKTDTDGDGLDDCAEIRVHHTDPNRGSSTGRGAIRGRVVLDDDKDPATRNHPGIGGWTVFVDLDFDGEWDASEPSATSRSDGGYEIAELDPGFYRVSLSPQPVWIQVFPTLTPLPTPDGYPDRVVEVFDSGTGPIPFPYGRYADPLPGVRVVVPSPPPDPVEASVVLGALPPSPIAGPFGGWAHVDMLAIPTNSFVTVAFDGEEIVDGPGPDLAIWCAARTTEDSAELSLGITPDQLTSAGIYLQEETILVDLASLSATGPVRYVKMRGLGLTGTYPGIDVVGFEALHYRPLTRGHYEVTVVGGQTVDAVDFGVAGDDRPPKISISTDLWDVRAGQSVTATVTVTDDVGVAAASLMANGAAVTLDAQFRGVVPVTTGGLLTLTALATDTAGQQATSLTSLIARNEDGSLPDLSGLGAQGGNAEGGPSIQVLSPVAGEILSEARVIRGTIMGTAHGVAHWQVHYAPAHAVNPEALEAPDDDFELLGEGTGPVIQGSLGTLPGEALLPGAYLLRVTATDNQGTTRYTGFVIGVRVEPLDIRPGITITGPTNDTSITYLTEIRGRISTRQELREWSVEYAPLSQVNLQNLSDSTPRWTRIAQGTEPVADGVLAVFDPTVLPNDAYVLRVNAWNKNGLGWAEPLVLQVTGRAKLGNFAVEFVDLQLPLAGVPIRLSRVYNSFNADKAGAFGQGWSLALQDADIAETVPQTGSGFGSTPFRVGTRVYLSAPDGQRVGFTLQPEVGAVSFLGAVFKAVFQPDPGVRYTLEVPEGDSAFLSVRSNGDLALFFLPVPWNPDTYVLTDPAGIRYTYDQRDGLIEMRDASGNRVSFTETAITHSSGPELRLTRDSAGRITQIVAPDARTWRYRYDDRGDLVEVTYPGNLVATLGYSPDRPHFLETINDPAQGFSQRTEYDANGRVIALVDAQGNRREQRWDPGSFSGTATDARGNVTRLTYNLRGNLTRREDPLGGVTTWEYSNAGFPDLETATTDPLGNRTRYGYDVRGNLTEVNPAVGQRRRTYSYDEKDHLVAVSYGTGGREELDYDAQGNVIRYRRNFPSGEWTLTHTAGGSVASILDPQGGLTRFEYDRALGSPSRIVAPDGGVKAFEYDASGRLLQFTDSVGGITRYEYDTMGRLTRQVDPAGGEIRTTYEAAFPSRPATVTDRVGRVTRYAYDTLGRLQQVTAPDGSMTRYEYDAEGNRTAVVDPLGNRYEFRYDAMSRLTEETDPVGKQRRHTHDMAGNRIGSTDRNGRQRTFAYDRANRLREEQWQDPADGRVVRTITFNYDGLDRLIMAADPDSDVRWSWLLPPVQSLESERASYSGLPERRIASAYDGAGRRKGLGSTTGTKAGWALAFTRDTAGRLRVVTSHPEASRTVVGNTWQLQRWLNTRGDVTELRRFADRDGGNRVSQSFMTYSDPCACRLERMEHVVATNQPLPEPTMAFTRDSEGGLLEVQEGASTLAFAYDAVGQLIRSTRDGVVSERYAYDLNGNRTSSHRHPVYDTGPGNRLVRAGPWILSYDHEGNLITKSNTVTGLALALTWDHRNRLTRVQRDEAGPAATSDTTEYRYDGIDRRIAVIRGGRTQWTYYDGEQPLMDCLDDEIDPMTLYYGGEKIDDLHLVWRRGEGAFWVLTDPLGTVRRVLNATNGVVVASLQYDSFGNPAAATGAQPPPTGRFGFAGREWDATTGLYYNRARYYDPDMGRFISEDPIGFAGGDSNLYRYAQNSPHVWRDPTGKTAAAEYAALTATLTFVGSTSLALSEACSVGRTGKTTGGVAVGALGATAGGAASAGLGFGVIPAAGSIGAAGPVGAAGLALAGVFLAVSECLF